MKSSVLVITAFLLSFSSAFASDLFEIPENPVWNQDYIVYYNLNSAESSFEAYDDVNAAVSFFYYDNIQSLEIAGESQDSTIKFTIRIPENASNIAIYFFSKNRNKQEEKSFRAMILNDKAVPAKGANMWNLMFSRDNFEENIATELELYPDSYYIFHNKWQNYRFYKESFDSVLSADIAYLEAASPQTADILCVLSEAAIRTDNIKKSENLLKRLYAEFPKSFFTAQAFTYYMYNAMVTKTWDDPGPQTIQKLNTEAKKKYPDSYLGSYSFSAMIGNNRENLHELFSIEDIRQRFEYCLTAAPNNPGNYLAYGKALMLLNGDQQEALDVLYKAINIILERKSAYVNYGDDSRRFTSDLPNAYLMTSEIQFNLGCYARAMADVNMAKKYTDRHLDEALLLEAKIWQKTGFIDKAENKYFEAAKLKNEEAKDSLKAILTMKYSTLQGFDDYLSKGKPSSYIPDQDDLEAAPDFDITDINGNRYKLSEIKNKVIVLNFWFTGCAPCIMELPALNELRDQYKDKDVLFLAFALDSKAGIHKFIKKRNFKYELIASAKSIANKYNVSSYPTHFVIDKNRKIKRRFGGGFSKDDNQLEAYIDKCLEE